jgi:hypothetical protein
MAVVWKGISSLTEQPDSPRYVQNQDGFRETRKFSGEWNQVLAGIPPRGARLNGSPAGYRVVENLLDREPGDKGTLIVISDAEDVALGSVPPPGEPIYEIEWIQTEKALTQLDYFANSGTCPHDKIAWYFDGADKAERDAIKAELTAAGAVQALLCIELREKGIDGYMAFYPVVRVTTPQWEGVLNGKCGTYRNPGVFAEPVPGVDGGTNLPFIYVKTADRCTKTGKKGKWERFEEWTGFVELPTDNNGNILFYKQETGVTPTP